MILKFVERGVLPTGIVYLGFFALYGVTLPEGFMFTVERMVSDPEPHIFMFFLFSILAALVPESESF